MNQEPPESELDRLIPPEIKKDEFYAAIQRIVKEENIKTVLEIGSSSGEGSSEALVRGLREKQNKPTLFCLEISKTRFAELQKRYANETFVKCYNVSSVSLEDFPGENEIIQFYNTTQSNLNYYPLDQVLSWLRQDVEYVKNAGSLGNGIQLIKEENHIDFFDAVLVDGSEFTGSVELEQVYGANFIFLDDINTFKNYRNHQRLSLDKNYILLAQNTAVRNGYSIFKKVNKPELPVHFFTLVLNGEPFIGYHIDVFKQLPFRWHWHIVEGVADLKHDTSWSLALGGNITEAIHHQGRSNDGTTEYLDELARLYPENVKVYRQPENVFWDGKREMVNAPLANIHEECLLWQVDVDELWTVQQLCNGRQIFIENPEKTAAFYWCWYFVGKNLVISTRNCYAQNPQQEWLRTWRFKPGAVWAAHEPPILVEPLPDNQWRNVAAVNPFLHEETEEWGLIFQHFAYVTPRQLQFKEQYYGYKNAVSQWTALQEQDKFPVLLRQYFPWVRDDTMVDTAESCGVVPIAHKVKDSDVWQFRQLDDQQKQSTRLQAASPSILVDGVFFQLYPTGIARVWQSLLEEWTDNGFSKHIVVLDRGGTAPKIPGIRYRLLPPYDYSKTDTDREMLQQVCDEEGADLFISTYYTTPLSTPSVFMTYDMIPEVLEWNLQIPMWQEKHYGIQQACAYIAISQNTARDLVKFFPHISLESVTVAPCGVKPTFFPASLEEVNSFKTKYGIAKPYFIAVGAGGGYKNTILFFKAFAQLCSKNGFDIVCTGSSSLLEDEFRVYTAGSVVHMLQLSDEELRAAYSGSVALVYPSIYEGFGLPLLEALACGCPVITCPNASIPEVAGEAALYVKDNDVEELVNALCEIQKPGVRQSLISVGLEQAKKFSWSKMAQIVGSTLIKATLEPLKLKDTNLIVFPDWTQPEEVLTLDLERVIKAIATQPNRSHITLLVHISGISQEDANLFLSGVAMNLLMQEDLDVTEGLEISLVGKLGEIQWKALLPRLNARIVLENENQQAIAAVKAETIPVRELGSLLPTG
jgi:glycosyltransferase involved in cell wall biosynthesis